MKRLQKRTKKLPTPNATVSILTATIVALAAIVGGLIARLRAAADPEKRAIREIMDGTDKLKGAIEKVPPSTLRGSPVLQQTGTKLDDIRAAVEAGAPNGKRAPATIH